jgi:tRNA threonylcarbamoyladenosine modification (KEOPS) complex Cgi121 subunit
MKTSDIPPIFRLSSFFVSIIISGRSESVDSIKLMDQVRRLSGNTYIQGFNTEVIFGIQHLIEALKITLESLRRGITVAHRPELDLMLRISCTTQISEAIQYAGIRSGKGVCLVIFSKNKQDLVKARDYILAKLPESDHSKHSINTCTRNTIATKLGLEANSHYLADDTEFLKYLIERAALITK